VVKIIDTSELTQGQTLPPADREFVYNGLDCCVTLEVLDALTPQLDNVSSATYEFSRSLQGPVFEMALRGILVDQTRRMQTLAKFEQEIDRVREQLDEILRDGVGCELNWRSPVQLKSLLYDVMGLPPVRKRNAQGRMAPTVNRDALERLSSYFYAEPICNHLLALRDLDKKRSFLKTGIDHDGRLRASFNIAGTNTGRLSSSMSDFGTGTNMQNIDRDLRSVLVADPGMKFANLDLEQADARNVGAICWNTFLNSHGAEYAGSYLDACESGDLHTQVCRMAWHDLAWGDDPSTFRATADQIAYRHMTYRDLAKRLGHGTNYYGTPRTMAKHSKVATHIIDDFQRAYFRAFPVIGGYIKERGKPNWHSRVRDDLQDFGTITTLFGRRRKFWGRLNDDATLREAIAYAPQSMTADEIDTGILTLFRANRVQLLLQGHDSILMQYPEELEDEIVPWALESLRTELELEGGRKFVVPTEAKVGWNYGDRQNWTKDDYEQGCCGKDEIGTCKENPDGLVKWKGHDSRTREQRPSTKLSVWNL